MGKKQIFGIRKLKTGVASVIIGAVLFGGNVVQAEEVSAQETTELNATSDSTTSLVEDEETSVPETTELNATSDSTTSLVEDEETSVPETTELNATSDSTTSLVEDDEEANRVETSNTITTPPVNEVIERGSKVTVLDNESPKLIDVTINQSIYHPGDEVRGSIIFEEESDLSYVSFSFTNETDKGPTELGNGQSDVGNIKLKINSEGQYVYNYYTVVPDNVYSTTYTLNQIILEDSTQNRITYNKEDLPKVSFNVENNTGVIDNEAPKVIDVTMDKEIYHPGEWATGTLVFEEYSKMLNLEIEFSTEDNIGAKTIGDGTYGSTLMRWLNRDSTDRDSTGNYIYNFSLYIPENIPSTTYTLYKITLTDSAENTANLTGENLLPVSFQVINNTGVVDLDAPEVVDINMEKEIYQPGEWAYGELIFEEVGHVKELYLEYYNDTLHGKEKLVSGSYGKWLDKRITVNDKGQYVYRIDLYIPEDTPATTYSIGRVDLEDNASNFIRLYEPELPKSTFQVRIKEAKEETRTEEVAFEIEYVNNPDLLVGTEEVSQDGANGVRTIVEEVTTVGGEEIAREVISNEVTTAPVNKVVQVGTKALEKVIDSIPNDKAGKYTVTYTTTDADGNTVTKDATISVRSNDKPVITAPNQDYKVGDSIDPLKNVTDSDKENGTTKVTVAKIVDQDGKVIDSIPNDKAGKYTVTYTTTDADGNTVTKDATISVRSNEKPGNGTDNGNPSSNQPGNPSQPSNATNNGVINTSTNIGSKVNNGAVNSPELPQTGENNRQSQTMSFIGVLLAMFGSLLGFLGIKKRRND